LPRLHAQHCGCHHHHNDGGADINIDQHHDDLDWHDDVYDDRGVVDNYDSAPWDDYKQCSCGKHHAPGIIHDVYGCRYVDDDEHPA
jgi:hypothetical protein